MVSEQAKLLQKKYRHTEKGILANRRGCKKYYTKVKLEIFFLLGNKCANPYNLNHGDFLTDIRCFQIDHINGGGKKEIDSYRNPFAYFKMVLEKIKSGSKDYQLLCANCNWIKRHENKEIGSLTQ